MRAIDADALIPMMRYATIDNEIGIFPIKIGFDVIIKVIDEQPTIEPERKRGKWISAQINKPSDKVACSNCLKVYDWISDAQYYNYCPNCGARMEEGEQDEID